MGDICDIGDWGKLFHDEAFSIRSRRDRALLVLTLSERMTFLARNGMQHTNPLMEYLVERTKSLTEQDLFDLAEDFWRCIAAGCGGCKALEIFGVCLHDVADDMRKKLFAGLAVTMQWKPFFLDQWWNLLELPSPPPYGYGLSEVEMNQRLVGKGEALDA